jgi:hypothetical protein
VTCNGTSVGYGRVSAVDDFVISVYGGDYSDSRWSQVYWWTAESIAHSLSYGIYNSSVACDQMHMFYVESEPIDGMEQKINVSSDATGHYPCQNTTQGAFTIHNDGSVGINVSLGFNQITSGVGMKLAHTNDGWQSNCSGTCSGRTCNLSVECLHLTTSDLQIAYNIQQNGSNQYWMWADFNGVANTFSPTKGNMTTNATKYFN